MNIRNQKKLGEILIAKKMLSQRQLDEALREQARTKEFLGTILIRTHQIDEAQFLTAMSEQFNMPVITLTDKFIDWKLLKHFSPTLIIDYKCFPVAQGDSGLTIAITNPLDAWVLAKAEEESQGARVLFVLVTQKDMDDAIARYKQQARTNLKGLF
ncbi:MAG: hypothetical protein PHQ96_01865 [Candidatus Omnitrophica bacterium]|nr:hypothetical protein [Candidatus Omnitrophota bacterium]